MAEFIDALLTMQFMQYALAAGVLSSIACGVTGTFVNIKRISYLGGGIAHAVMGGVGIAYFLRINPLFGALAFALAAALMIGWIKRRFRQQEDTLISALWSVGMATGLIFTWLTPGYNVDLLSFLFGNILMVSGFDLLLLALLDMLIGGAVFVFYRQLVYLCFDEEYAELRGISVDLLYLLLLCLIAVTVVILIQAVGLVLVIALLTLPSAIAGLFLHRPAAIMLAAAVLCSFFTMLGLYLSFNFDLPSGASIILITGLAYLLALGMAAWRTSRLRAIPLKSTTTEIT